MADRAELAAATEATLTSSRALLGIIARSVADALGEVTLPQFRVMVVLSTTGPLKLGTLAERVGANLSTFSRGVDRMVAGGWVVRTENPDSRREVLVGLTDVGHSLVTTITERRRRDIEAVLARLAPRDQQAVADALQAFSRAAGEPAVEDLLVLGL